MDKNIKYMPDDWLDITEKSKMYYHLCCGDDLWNDFDWSWINTWNNFYKNSWYIWSIAVDNDKYVWFVVSKNVNIDDEYIIRNYWFELLNSTLSKLDKNISLDEINYIDWLYIYPKYRKQNIWSDLLLFHEKYAQNKWYKYSMLEYNTYEKWYLWKFYGNNGYIKFFDYTRIHKFDNTKTKIKTLLIKIS